MPCTRLVLPWRNPEKVVPFRLRVNDFAVTEPVRGTYTWSDDAVPERVVQLDLIWAHSSGSHWKATRSKCWPLSQSWVVIRLVRA